MLAQNIIVPKAFKATIAMQRKKMAPVQMFLYCVLASGRILILEDALHAMLSS